MFSKTMPGQSFVHDATSLQRWALALGQLGKRSCNMWQTHQVYDYTLKAQVKMVLFIAKEEIADRKFPLPTLL